MPHTDMSAPSAHGSFKPAFKPVTITPEELDACSDSHPQGSFQQTTAMMEVARSRVDSFDMVGIRDENGTLVAGCFIAYTRGRFGLEGSVWLGPLCDPHDVPMLKAMTGCISDSARRHGAMSVTCWPNLVYQRHDSQGAPEGEPDAAALHAYESLGWRHAGFGQGYGSVVNQWVYVKDLTGIADEKALFKSYDKRTQWSVKRAQSMGVTVRELGIDELQSFADIETATAQRRHFQDRGIAYFRQFKQAFGDKAHFMLAEIHIDDYMADMTAKREALATKVARLQAKNAEHPTTKTERQLGEETRNLAAAEKRLAEAAEFAKDGDVLPAAASLFVEHPNEVVYFFSGSVERYKPFYASALIQYEAMLHLCVEKGVPRYNFYGISGVFDDPNDEGRGVLEFKQGFNGYVEQMVGKFTLPVDKFRFGVSNLAHKLLRR